MKKLLFVGFMAILNSTVHASVICTPEDVSEAANILSGFKKAMEAGEIHKVRFLQQERVYFKSQYCAKQISSDFFCLAMSSNLKEQLQIARQRNDRAYYLSVFENYIDSMNSLPNACK